MMSRAINFFKRNTKEILRDTLSYVFCLGFPLVMLMVFYYINKSIPAKGVTMFEIGQLAPGIAIFSYSFVMLFVTLLVSKDRSTSFLTRLLSSSMRASDYILGYTIAPFIIGIIQTVICYGASMIIAAIDGIKFSPLNVLLSMVSVIPCLIVYISFGVIFGSIFSDKAAPAMSSIIISASGMLGGCWMPVETMGSFETFCKILPFYPAVSMGRVTLNGANATFDNFLLYLIIVFAWAILSYIGAVFAFKSRMRSKNA